MRLLFYLILFVLFEILTIFFKVQLFVLCLQKINRTNLEFQLHSAKQWSSYTGWYLASLLVPLGLLLLIVVQSIPQTE